MSGHNLLSKGPSPTGSRLSRGLDHFHGDERDVERAWRSSADDSRMICIGDIVASFPSSFAARLRSVDDVRRVEHLLTHRCSVSLLNKALSLSLSLFEHLSSLFCS